MKLKSLLLALLVMFSGVVMAQVESGKVYRIVSSKYGTVITANPINHTLTCVTKGGDSDYQQMWEFVIDEETKKFSIMNLFSRRYIQNEDVTNAIFKTGEEKVLFAVLENAVNKGNYNIDANSRADGWGLHCDASSNVVPWKYGPDEDGISGTEWKFEEISIDEAGKEYAYEEFTKYNNVIQSIDDVVIKVNALFEDKAGTVLKEEYASKTDEELLALMEGVPAELQQAVLKVKNDSWAVCAERPHLGEKNFRVYEYKPYSDTDEWMEILFLRPFNRINNPTGICSESDKGFIYVFVDQVPEGSQIYLSEMPGTEYLPNRGHETELKEGLNIVPSLKKDGTLYVRYVVDTHTGFDINNQEGTTAKLLADYPNVKVHIEGGYVNGFWSKERGHTNEDWVYMGKNMFHNEGAVQAKGDFSLLNFRKKEFLQAYTHDDYWGFRVEGCPKKIMEVMEYWDFWNERQRHYMGLDKYANRFNNMQLAMSSDGGFMDAGNYRTHYNNNTLTTIVNYDRISRDGGSAWGPNHEIGHTNQYAFQIVGTSEVSNNALANFAIFDTGTHTSRGWDMTAQIEDFEKKLPFVVRGEGEYGHQLFSMTRMYFQLFLYFHAAGNCPDFYPRLFEELRKDRLVGWVTTADRNNILDENGYYVGSMDATNDQLKFVEKCCEVAQMDLTEFFEAWGFFIPMKNAYVGDYGHHYVYLHQEDIDACKARIKAKNYPKKGGQIMFLEDRIRPTKQKKSPFSDGTGYRADYSDEVPVGKPSNGVFGQWEDCLNVDVKAEGYYYAIVNNKVVIKEDTGAKGALGFKLYDAKGNLLSYTNNYEMNVPLGVDRAGLNVVAAQADGENAPVKHLSEGPSSMQRSALENAIKRANTFVNRKMTEATADRIGRIYPEALTNLEENLKNAKAAFNNYDQKVHYYSEWAVILEDDCNTLAADKNSMLNLKEGTKVALMSSVTKGVMVSTGNGVKSDQSADLDMANTWSIEYAGTPGFYYLKASDGQYVRNFTIGSMIDANEPGVNTAEKFSFAYTENGDVLFVAQSTQESFGSEDGKVVPMGSSDANACWEAYCLEDNSEELYKKELVDALDVAHNLCSEILIVDSIGHSMNYFSENIVIIDRNLEQIALDLYNMCDNVSKDIDNVKRHQEYLNSLREKTAAVYGKYAVSSPIATQGKEIAWYRLVSTENGNYLSLDSYKRLKTVDPAKVDDCALWCFVSTGVKGQYVIYNCDAKGYVYSKSTNLYAGGEERVPVLINYSANDKAVSLSLDRRKNGNYESFYDTSKKVELNKDDKVTTYWELELVDIEENAELADFIITTIEEIVEENNVVNDGFFYDLSGRRVLNPVKGIYIHNGKKMLVR